MRARIAVVDLALLNENRLKGATIPLPDKRNDFHGLRPEIASVT